MYARYNNMEIYENYPLKELNTFGIDVKARRLVYLRGNTPDDTSRFERDMDELLASGLLKERYMILGEGSNIVFTGDYDGTIIKVGVDEAFGGGDKEGRLLTVGAQVLIDNMVELCLQHHYYGAENLTAIPGNMGAAVVQNVGAYGVEIKDLVERVDTVDLLTGERRSFSNSECEFGYRDSIFKHHPGRWLIWRVCLRLANKFEPNLKYKALADEVQRRGLTDLSAYDMRRIISELRWSKLPRPEENGSAGSFFKNPVVDGETYRRLREEHPEMPEAHPSAEGYKLSAGWLIDRAGWKGYTNGRVGVWPKNALVLYNAGGCTGDDVVMLAKAIQQNVQETFGVSLTPEAIIV